MDRHSLNQFLRSNHLVSLRSAELISESFALKVMNKGQFLLKEGTFSDEYFFLEQGFMRAFAHDMEGNEVTTSFYLPNQVVFEVSSFFNRTRSKENIQAITNCRGWYISYDQLNELFHSMPEFRELGRSILEKGFASLKTRMLSLITETAEQRYDTMLKTYPEIFQYAALKHIASYLGITDSSLSRIRKDYSRK